MPWSSARPWRGNAGLRLSVTALVGSETSLVAQELVPRDIRRVDIVQAHWPLRRRPTDNAAVALAWLASSRVEARAPVDVGARIGRVLEQAQHPTRARRLPGDGMWLGAASPAHWQREPGLAQVVHDGPR